MVKRLMWATTAKIQRKEILEYWTNRNKSKSYSRKLNKLFKECAEMITRYPEIGVELPDQNCRKRLIRDFYFIYTSTENEIEIVTIWDTRQNPEKLKNTLGL